MSDHPTALQMTDDQFAAFTAAQNTHNEALRATALLHVSLVQESVNAQKNPQPPIPLRDWFAGQALAGMLADPNVRGGNIVTVSTIDAYRFADAMLAAREAQS